MKQKDIVLIVAAVGIAGIMSYFGSRALFSPGKHTEVAEVVESISTEFPVPDQKFFNARSVDPTQLIKIGDSSNPKPFNSPN